MRQSKAAMRFIMVVVLIDMLTLGLSIPVLPPLVGTFAHGSAGQTFWYGVLVFCFGLASFLAAPLLGTMSDLWGRRRVLLFGILGVSASLILTSLAQTLWMLVIARTLCGATQANLAIANAYIADITPPAQLAQKLGLLGAMIGVGAVIGPALGGLLGALDLRLPFVVAAILALLNWLYGYFFLPESRPRSRHPPFRWPRRDLLGAIARTFGAGTTRKLLLAIGANCLAQLAFSVAWVLYTQYRYGWGPRESGLSLALIGIAALIVQGGLVGPASRQLSGASLSLAAICCGLLAYLWLGFAFTGWMFFLAVPLHAIGFASIPAMQAELARTDAGADRGRVFGVVASANALAGVLAPLAASTALQSIAGRNPSEWLMGMPMFMCAAIQAFALILALNYFRPSSVRGATAERLRSNQGRTERR